MTDATKDPNHDILSTYRWCHAETDSVFYRVVEYDAAAGTVGLRMHDDDSGCVEKWLLTDGEWVCQDSHCEKPGDVRETDFVGADRCCECGCMFTASRPDEGYCGCH